jgi:hypothetical protein
MVIRTNTTVEPRYWKLSAWSRESIVHGKKRATLVRTLTFLKPYMDLSHLPKNLPESTLGQIGSICPRVVPKLGSGKFKCFHADSLTFLGGRLKVIFGVFGQSAKCEPRATCKKARARGQVKRALRACAHSFSLSLLVITASLQSKLETIG